MIIVTVDKDRTTPQFPKRLKKANAIIPSV
jgi:hypothetical protein